MRPDVADAPECAMTDRSAAMAETVLPAISRYFLIFPWLLKLWPAAQISVKWEI
jgi:hypothetical protein